MLLNQGEDLGSLGRVSGCYNLAKKFSREGGVGGNSGATKGRRRSALVFDAACWGPAAVVQLGAVCKTSGLADDLVSQLFFCHVGLRVGRTHVANVKKSLLELLLDATKREAEVFVVLPSCSQEGVQHPH
ncbi:MAG: hypothetical protein ACX936_21455, partial [Marinobacter sp.]